MLKTNRPRLFFALLATAGLPLVAGFAPAAAVAQNRNTDYSKILSASDTDAVFVVDDFLKYGRFDEKSPVAKLLASPAVKALGAGFLPEQSAEIVDELGLSSKEIARLFSGKGATALVLKRPDSAKPPTSATEAAPEEKEETKGDDGSSQQVITRKTTTKATFEFGREGFLSYDKLALVEFRGSPAEYEELAGKLEAETKRRAPSADIKRERVEGVVLRTIDIAEADAHKTAFKSAAYLALYEGTVIVSTNRGILLDTIHSLARGSATDPLSGRSDYLADKKEMGESDGFFFVNLGVTTVKLRENILRLLEAQVEANPMVKAMVDPRTVVDALALENFTSLYGSVTVSEEQVEARYGLTWKDPAGLASLIRFGGTPVTIPAIASGDYKGIDVTTADYRSMWEAGDHLVQTALPSVYPMLGMSLASQPSTGKILSALRKGVLENLVGEMVSLTGFSSAAPPEDELPSKAMVFQVRDPAAAQAALEELGKTSAALQGKSGGRVEPKDYLGVKIYRLTPPLMISVQTAHAPKEGGVPDIAPTPPQLSYFFCAVVGTNLVISAGTEEFTKGVIANVQKPSRAGVANKFKDDLGDIPGTLCSISYGDVATYLVATLNASLQPNVLKTSEVNRDDLLKARADAKDLHYSWIGKSYASPNGFFGCLAISADQTAN